MRGGEATAEAAKTAYANGGTKSVPSHIEVDGDGEDSSDDGGSEFDYLLNESLSGNGGFGPGSRYLLRRAAGGTPPELRDSGLHPGTATSTPNKSPSSSPAAAALLRLYSNPGGPISTSSGQFLGGGGAHRAHTSGSDSSGPTRVEFYDCGVKGCRKRFCHRHVGRGGDEGLLVSREEVVGR